MTEPLCERLEWDSTFFGLAVARVRVCTLTPDDWASVRAWCREERIACLYVLAAANYWTTTDLLERAGAHLVDLRVTLNANVSDANGVAPGDGAGPADVRAATTADIGPLRTIAGESHRNTRFYADAHFDRHRCDQMYRLWIEQDCSGAADRVLVVEREDRPVGYITLHVTRPGIGRIGLLGVAHPWRQRGIGHTLIVAGLAWLAARQVTCVSVVTQGTNAASQRLYQRAGFRTADVSLWYHWWPASTA